MKGEDKRIVNVASFAASRAPMIDFDQVNSSSAFSTEISQFLAHYTAVWRKKRSYLVSFLKCKIFISVYTIIYVRGKY
jgi:hypothetical protein